MRRRARALVSLAGATFVLAGLAAGVQAQSPLPAAPARYFNDYAGVVSPEVAQRLDQKLEAFDDQTSSQIVVAVFPELPSPSLEDFTVRTAQAWRVGRKKLANGVVFFVFVKDRQMRIETGYGLEGALPDVTAHRILDERVSPALRSGDYAGGLEAGIDGIIAAIKGEYRASPAPVRAPARGSNGGSSFFVILIVLFIVIAISNRRQSRTYGRRGWGGGGPWWWGGGGLGGGFGGGGGGWSGGGGFGGGGGFSGGGGSFGGGGASGRW